MRSRRTFPVFEFAVVMLVLGVLAAIVMPRLTPASARGRADSARTMLNYLRGQIDVFRREHGGVPPAAGSLWGILRRTSDRGETTSAEPRGTGVGPYIDGTPANPWNQLSGVSGAERDAGAGFYYAVRGTDYTLRLRNADGSVNYVY